MKPFTSSIRRHLLCWLLLPITSLCLIGAAVTYALAVDFATDAYDDALLDCAHSLASRLEYKSDTLTVDMPPAARAILKHGDKDNTFYQIRAADGKVISGDTFIPEYPPDADLLDEPYFYDGHIEGQPVRCAAIDVELKDVKKQRVVIKVAETVSGRSQLIQSIFLGVLIPQVLLIVLAALAVWLGVARGLSPLGKLKEAVERRNPSDLRSLSEKDVPKEVKPLVISINKLLERLREDRESQKRFLSNAAHQLRTPLAGLKTQTELALRQTSQLELNESLLHINTSAARAARLAQQLLALARVEPSVFKSVGRESLDINLLVRDVSRELVGQAISKNIDLGFEGLSSPAFVSGDRSSLYEMIFNIVENAILYTQRGGWVTAELKDEDSQIIVRVEDNGPGIPPAEREMVFERFYRILGNKVNGSGLGLAIVREIAAAHDIGVELKEGRDGVGSCFELRFARLEPPASAPMPLGARTVSVL